MSNLIIAGLITATVDGGLWPVLVEDDSNLSVRCIPSILL